MLTHWTAGTLPQISGCALMGREWRNGNRRTRTCAGDAVTDGSVPIIAGCRAAPGKRLECRFAHLPGQLNSEPITRAAGR
jgi:hypothetical protein